MPYAILALVLVALDQLVKYLVLQNIPLGGHVPFIPYLLELTYVQNTGAAFSIFSEHTWMLALVSLVMSVVLAALGMMLFPIFTVYITDLVKNADRKRRNVRHARQGVKSAETAGMQDDGTTDSDPRP